MSVTSMISCSGSIALSYMFYKQAANRSPLQMFIAFLLVSSVICLVLNLISATQCAREQEQYRKY